MRCFQFFKKKSKKATPKGGKLPPELRGENGKFEGTNSSKNSSASPRSILEMYKEKEHNLKVFSLSELRNATNNFNRLLKIGQGGFGSVYKGKIRPQSELGEPYIVAIKKLNKHGLQGHKEWHTEVQFLGIVDHPNLVKLLGYCSAHGGRGMQLLLVYEYMPNKSLEDHLFNRAVPTVPWNTRLQIMLGVAQGLAYLHNGLEIQVIYRDFKASNVLLDSDFNPKLSDFGLAREGPKGDKSHVSTAPVGTHGYAAPEYVETGRLTTHCDLWSFGVVLYEILSGRRTLEKDFPTSEQKLLEWVKQFPADSKRFHMIIDPRIRNHCPLDAARSVAKLADSCLNKNPKDRPTMNEVVERLKLAIQESEDQMKLSDKITPEVS